MIERQNIPSAGLLTKFKQQTELNQARIYSQELNPGLTHRWQRSKYLDQYPLYPRMYNGRKLDFEAEVRFKHKHFKTQAFQIAS